MNHSTVNFTTTETLMNSTTLSFRLVDRRDIFLCSINFLFGLPTHSYVIWLIITGAGSGVASEFFNLNLSVCEIGICLNCLLYTVKNKCKFTGYGLYFFTVYILDSCTWFSHLKALTYLLLGLASTGRTLFQCLMCVERYLAVVHPVTFLKFKPLRYRVICCNVACIITLGSCLCSMFSLISNNIHIWFFLIQYILFLSIQLFCLVAVLRALKQSGPGERRRDSILKDKRRAFYLILITTVSMIIIYVPFIISGFSFILTQHFIRVLFSYGFICYVLAGFVQPVPYLRRTGKLSCFCSP